MLARVAGNKRLRDALYLQAFTAPTASPGARAYYDAYRATGATPTKHSVPWPTASSASCTLPTPPSPLRRGHRLA
ncbi:hypothetical protein Franean1_3176 [Parafrankia sp. EAN1pec]|nr:hypothetical protein Franean1_3176 [Frankia sp. EAN1pec]